MYARERLKATDKDEAPLPSMSFYIHGGYIYERERKKGKEKNRTLPVLSGFFFVNISKSHLIHIAADNHYSSSAKLCSTESTSSSSSSASITLWLFSKSSSEHSTTSFGILTSLVARTSKPDATSISRRLLTEAGSTITLVIPSSSSIWYVQGGDYRSKLSIISMSSYVCINISSP